jgi:hypothetical protein
MLLDSVYFRIQSTRLVSIIPPYAKINIGFVCEETSQLKNRKTLPKAFFSQFNSYLGGGFEQPISRILFL